MFKTRAWEGISLGLSPRLGSAWAVCGLSSECYVVILHCADDVTLVLQELQYLLQHRFTQAWAEAQASTGQDVQEVAALFHVIWFLAVFLNDTVYLSVQFLVFSGYIE